MEDVKFMARFLHVSEEVFAHMSFFFILGVWIDHSEGTFLNVFI